MRLCTRDLRILVSAFYLFGCVLFTALWVRSYWYHDFWTRARAKTGTVLTVSSASGQIRMVILPLRRAPRGTPVLVTQPIPPTARVSLRPLLAPEKAIIDLARGLLVAASPTWTVFWFEYWIPTYLLGALAIVPWLSWRPRFRLRNLVIGTLLILVLVVIAIKSLP